MSLAKRHHISQTSNLQDELFTFGEKPTDRVHHTIHEGIQKVCTTSGGIFILSSNGRVYGIGSLGRVWLTDFSKLSLTRSESQSKFALFDSNGFEDKLFTDIIGGSNVLFLLSTENELFAIGQNDYAITGQDLPESMTSLTRIVTFLDEDEYPVLATVCFSSSLVYTNKNHVFVMGQTSWFLDVPSQNYMPLTYQSNKKIVSMSGAHFHANMLDEDGNVYVCGEQSDFYKLGIREKVIDLTPLDTIKERVLIAHCAFNHSIFVTESQRVLICGFDLPGQQYNNIPFLIELEIKDRLPMTFVTHVSSTDSRAIVHTNNGVYSSESVVYDAELYVAGCMTSELKRIPGTFFERGLNQHFRNGVVDCMKSSCGANHTAFYTSSHCSAVTVVRAFPRLFEYAINMVLTNVEIIT